ncbi:YceI family protein [Dyella monticola]|uniref:YceI family protein n=1 Tax=Dyella monticola TaxID=1927958 RepID=A0A370WTZ9_9GAMM|nr:YceI family protein [Dyella monticola]
MRFCNAPRKRPWRRIVPLLLWLPLPLLAANSDTDYRIDPGASQAAFHLRVFWVDSVNGHFTHVDGDMLPGPHPASWVVNATIPVDSVAMSSTHLRQWVLDRSFFDAKDHPTIHFVSDPIAQSALDDGGTLTGYLTLRGITAPIRFAVEPMHCEQSVSAPCTIVLHGDLHRSTFGMTSDRVALSDSVQLNLSITLQRETR